MAILSLSIVNLKALVIQEINGYIRGAYQLDIIKNSKSYIDDAIGAKLHFETSNISNISIGGTLYTSKVVRGDNMGLVPFRGEDSRYYTILGEAYIKGDFGNNIIKIGRQEIDTPFAQIDDIGIIPNSFEAVVLINRAIENTTIFLTQLQKMSGVDAPIIDRFTDINGERGVQSLGIIYDGINNLSLSSWYYYLDGAQVDSIAYFETNYEGVNNRYSYSLAFQCASERYIRDRDSYIYGVSFNFIIEKFNLTLLGAYNKVNGNMIKSGFGGGPFYSNSEYLIIDNGGAGAEARLYGIEWSQKDITVGISKMDLVPHNIQEATEIDLILNYKLSKRSVLKLIASKIDGSSVDEENSRDVRVFIDYNF